MLIERFLTSFKRIRHWLPWINRASGAMLLVLGVLLFTGSFSTLSALLSRWTPEWLSTRL